jgi:hypothetical protein
MHELLLALCYPLLQRFPGAPAASSLSSAPLVLPLMASVLCCVVLGMHPFEMAKHVSVLP